MTASVYRWY